MTEWGVNDGDGNGDGVGAVLEVDADIIAG